MSNYDYDLFVIGNGSGGTRTGRIATSYGKKVAFAESRHYGGTCVNLGCVPKKLMAYAASFAHHFEDSKGYGWSIGNPKHDWKAFIEAKNKEIKRLSGFFEKGIEDRGNGKYWGHAKITDPHAVDIEGEKVTAERILIATGGKPFIPDIPGAREYGITSDDIFYLEERPEKLVILGVGYIGLEFASIFNRLGTEVHVIFRRDQILSPEFDHDVRDFLQNELTKQGINFHAGKNIESLEKEGRLLVNLDDGTTLHADQVLLATGRKPNTENIGVKELGMDLAKNGAIIVNEDDQTSIPSIYAVGDVTDRIALTPVAIEEGHALADRLYGGSNRHISYENVPAAIFSNPPVGLIGLTEEQAKAKFDGKIDVYIGDFRSMKFTLSGRDERTLVKLVVEQETDKVVGFHMVGQDAPEITQGFATAMIAGATKADFDRTIAIHPTAAEEFVTLRQKTR